MDAAAQVFETAHAIYARAENGEKTDTASRPPAYKAIGIALAVTSGCFIGVSFVLKKVGLLKANEKYNEVAGEGYGYLKNFHWWAGMTLMIIGEICNFAAYAFTDAILVTSLGALSVVITTILSAIFLKERLSMVGKVACFLCIIGSVIIVLNAPTESAVANIQEMKKYVVTPGFLTYTGVIILGCLFVALWVAPRYGKKNMFPYISVCSWIGALSVVSTQGLGAAIVAQAGGTPQFNQWFLYVVLVFVIITLLTEIIYLNKALNLFNAAMVTPTYYVYFTSTTIITSSVLFQGFRGTAVQIITVVMGFLTICAGVVLLQLSKSAKDVPDTAIFTGDLDQIHMIGDQEQPETEPKADALRGTAAIVRRFSNTRQKMEEEEFRRLREEKEMERLAPLSEDGQDVYEWDGLRRRRTTTLGSQKSRAITTANSSIGPTSNWEHPPLGMSRFPDPEEVESERGSASSPGFLSSIAGTIRSRGRSVLLPGHPDFRQQQSGSEEQQPPLPSPPLQTVQLSEIAVPPQKYRRDDSISRTREHVFGLPAALEKTDYGGAASVHTGGSSDRHIQIAEPPPPTPPVHGDREMAARRQFSFQIQNVFRRNQPQVTEAHPQQQQQQPRPPSSSLRHVAGLRSRGYSDRAVPRDTSATEEERLGLVKGDSQSMPALPRYDSDESGGSGSDGLMDSDDSEAKAEEPKPYSSYGPRPGSRRRWDNDSPPPPPPSGPGGGGSPPPGPSRSGGGGAGSGGVLV